MASAGGHVVVQRNSHNLVSFGYFLSEQKLGGLYDMCLLIPDVSVTLHFTVVGHASTKMYFYNFCMVYTNGM